ncbi:MAG: leucine--tRNA ligase [Parcubacteria group bacterium]|nr:leucine--tRNA ligase [Parcubacteria group bacterium]
MSYDHKNIEKKWQDSWKESDLYRATEDPSKEKKFVLDMFPYPSGEGLHVGHPKGYIATDIYSRHMRMKGYSVLHPMGWDAFGLPAENFALKHKTHPRKAVETNIANFKAQLAHLGFDYDWSREINTTDPRYYHWTQWIFLKLLEHKLAFQSNEPINWCPSCMTGLANEDLDGAVCERCGTPVEKKALPQWVLKITDYADRMLNDLDTLNWPEHIKEAQRNWIGRSEGAEIDFLLNFKYEVAANNNRGPNGERAQLTVFTTRPDTLYGATYLVLAPEHPWVQLAIDDTHAVLENKQEVRTYVTSVATKSEIERGAEGREKTGVPLKGVVAINPATQEEIPLFVADYVLGSYGTGAIMAVPAHDERDYAFAQKFKLPTQEVVIPRLPDASNPHQSGKEVVYRRATINVVHDPKTDRYLILRWKKQPWITYVTGGVEEGEDLIESAKREIAEETGYTDLTFVRKLGGDAQAEFYAAHKGVNRIARNSMLLFELASDTRIDVAPEEAAQFDTDWVSRLELSSIPIQHSEARLILDRLDTPSDTYTGTGVLVHSGDFSGRDSEEVKWEIVSAVGGRKVTRYKLRDWVFSRQRYWGEPIPVIHCPTDGVVPVPYEDLPVILPEVESYEPTGTGESPLATIDEWVNVNCPTCGGPAKRETNTMPQWAGSSWYYLRFMDPENTHELVSGKKEKYWAPVDVYVGGDHAVRHLIYARFWHKFLYDIGVVSTQEPFKRLEFLGFILAEDGRKMSKRLGNIINPDDVVREYGADAFRIYEMFMGPFENTTSWSTASIKGTARFIDRLWGVSECVQDEPVETLDVLLHETVRKVAADIETFKFNTAVSQMMVFLNAIEKEKRIGKEQWKSFLGVLAPFAPHVTEELWQKLGEENSIHLSKWPVYDDSILKREEATVVIQVNGKRRGSLSLSLDISEADAVKLAREIPAVGNALDGQEPKRTIFVPGKIVNFVV